MTILNRLGVSAVVLLLSVSPAQADPITYMQSGNASGRLGSAAFVDAFVMLTMTADTADVLGSDGFFEVYAPATLSVAGIGTAMFTERVRVFVNQDFDPPAAGFAVDAGSIFDTFNQAFADFDLRSAIGPLSGPSFIRPDLTFATTRGGFNLDAAGIGTFSAAPVPEPGTMLLVATASSMLARRARLGSRST